MKTQFSLRQAAGLLAALLPIVSGQAATIDLPSSAALAAGTSTTRGFTVRSAQAPVDAVVANSYLRALHQLNGTLTDASGTAIANEAVAGPNTDGSYDSNLVNFEKDAVSVDFTDADGHDISFAADLFPGIPGSGSHTDNFAVEVVGFLDLSAGTHTFGISVGADRTDVNDDDNFSLFVGKNPRDISATKVTDYVRAGVLQPFVGNQHAEDMFTVNAPVSGLYPFRLVYWTGGRGANLQWYSFEGDNQDRVLINDEATDARAIKAYRDTSVDAAKGPYVAEVSPQPGTDGNPASAPITALIADGATTVSTANVKLYLNDKAVTPQALAKSGSQIALRYDPNATRTEANNLVRLEYTDSKGATYTNSWAFKINVGSASSTVVTGQWDFDGGDLSATVGKPLQYLDGANGLTKAGTQFGTTTALGVPDINGKVAKIMKVPGDLDRRIGYVMEHGIAPNGGGTRVNQYTIIYDILVSPGGAASLLQISSQDNAEGDDGDLFWQGNNFGQGTDGYKGTGAFTPNEWHRVVAAYDEAANPPVVTKYVDGIKQDDWTKNQSLDNPRRALLPKAVLFGDGDHDERHEMWVNSIQIRSGKLSDAEMVALGGPSADGIPQVIPASNVTGQWDFDRGNLSATVGKPLQYLDGPGGLTETGTVYGTTTELGVPDINGKVAKIMKVPGDLKREIGYVMEHGIAPNGGGTRVNQYTIIYDIMVSPGGAASLLQVSSEDNAEGDDGDLFWQGNNFGQGTDGYKGTGAFTPNEWHRVVAAYDEAATPPVVTKFVDGIKQDDWTKNQSLDNPRRALLPKAVLFGDGDHDERHDMWVNSIQIRSGKLTDAQIVALGGPSADGIPVATPVTTVTGQWDFDAKNLAATVGKPLQYLDGAGGLTETGTQYGTTTELGVPDINGEVAKIMKVPGDLDRNIGYIMEHGIAPNGGGTRVNQYTIIFDIMVSPGGAASLLQISSQDNAEGDDGDLFWQGNNFGQGTDGYKGTGAFTPNEWHRVVAAYDEAAKPPVVTKFVDGIFQDDWTKNQSLDNPRRALLPKAVLFGDGDHDERHEMWVNSIQIRNGALSKAEIVALGGPSAKGIPVVVPPVTVVTPPTLAVTRGTGSVTVTWDASATGFSLESTTSLNPANWVKVTGVTGNSATINTTGDALYLRLKQ